NRIHGRIPRPHWRGWVSVSLLVLRGSVRSEIWKLREGPSVEVHRSEDGIDLIADDGDVHRVRFARRTYPFHLDILGRESGSDRRGAGLGVGIAEHHKISDCGLSFFYVLLRRSAKCSRRSISRAVANGSDELIVDVEAIAELERARERRQHHARS